MAESEASSKTLRQALARLEQEVRVPMVPGEGESWCQNVSERLEEVLASYIQNLQGHRKQIGHISEVHSELASVAGQLQAREQELHEGLKELLARVGTALSADSEATQPDEVRCLNSFREEILASQRQMLLRRGEPSDRSADAQMMELFSKHLRNMEHWLGQQPNMRTLYVNYNELVWNPAPFSRKIREFLGGWLNARRMAAVVDTSLYRQRR